MVLFCPQTLTGEGPPDASCESFNLKVCVLGKRGTATPLQGGSFPVGGEIPARRQGAQGPGFHSGSATVFHETKMLKNHFRTQLAQSVHPADAAQTGEETCPEEHSWG